MSRVLPQADLLLMRNIWLYNTSEKFKMKLAFKYLNKMFTLI